MVKLDCAPSQRTTSAGEICRRSLIRGGAWRAKGPQLSWGGTASSVLYSSGHAASELTGTRWAAIQPPPPQSQTRKEPTAQSFLWPIVWPLGSIAREAPVHAGPTSAAQISIRHCAARRSDCPSPGLNRDRPKLTVPKPASGKHEATRPIRLDLYAPSGKRTSQSPATATS
jgi:hypothetical protein